MKLREFKISKGDFKNRSAEIMKVHAFMNDLPETENHSIKIGNWNSSKSDRQRRLNWRWNNEVSKSGMGRHDDPELIHLDAKYMFALPLLLEGEDEYSVWIQDKIMTLIGENHKANPEGVRKFIKYDIETEKMELSMVSDFLRSYQNYWTSKGVTLTDPSLQGLDLNDQRYS